MQQEIQLSKNDPQQQQNNQQAGDQTQQNAQELQIVIKKLGFDPMYLKPPSWHKDIKHTDQYISSGTGTQAKRKIYNNVNYTEFEQKGVVEIKQILNEKKQKIPDFFGDPDYLKLCYTARFNMKECIKKSENYFKWLNDESMHTLTQKSQELLKKGFIYCLGRDIGLRPVIVLDVTKVSLDEGEENVIRSLSVFLDTIRKYMFVPYHIENWVFIIDVHDKGLFSLPISALRTIIGTMSTNYCATLERMFIVNPPWILRTAWSQIQSFMDWETAQKIRLIKPDEYEEMRQQIPLQYLEKKYTGNYPDVVSDFWPPQDLFHEERKKEQLILKEKNEQERKKQQEILEQEKQKQIEVQLKLNQQYEKEEQDRLRQQNNVSNQSNSLQDQFQKELNSLSSSTKQQLKQCLFQIGAELIGSSSPVYFQVSQTDNISIISQKNNSVIVVDDSGNIVTQIRTASQKKINDVQWDSDSTHLAILQEDQVSLWEFSTKSIVDLIPFKDNAETATFIRWSLKEPVLAVGTSSGQIIFYNKQNKQQTTSQTKHKSSILQGEWNDDGVLITTSESSVIMTHNSKGQQEFSAIQIKNNPNQLKWGTKKIDETEKTQKMFSSIQTEKQNILLLSELGVTTNSFELNFQNFGQYGKIVDYCWFSFGQIMIAFENGTLIHISTNKNEMQQEQKNQNIFNEKIKKIDLLSSLNLIAVASSNTIKIFNFFTWQEKIRFRIQVPSEIGQIVGLKFIKKGELLLVSTDTGNLFAFSMIVPKLVSQNEDYISVVEKSNLVIQKQQSDKTYSIVYQNKLQYSPQFLFIQSQFFAYSKHNLLLFHIWNKEKSLENISSPQKINNQNNKSNENSVDKNNNSSNNNVNNNQDDTSIQNQKKQDEDRLKFQILQFEGEIQQLSFSANYVVILINDRCYLQKLDQLINQNIKKEGPSQIVDYKCQQMHIIDDIITILDYHGYIRQYRAATQQIINSYSHSKIFRFFQGFSSYCIFLDVYGSFYLYEFGSQNPIQIVWGSTQIDDIIWDKQNSCKIYLITADYNFYLYEYDQKNLSQPLKQPKTDPIQLQRDDIFISLIGGTIKYLNNKNQIQQIEVREIVEVPQQQLIQEEEEEKKVSEKNEINLLQSSSKYQKDQYPEYEQFQNEIEFKNSNLNSGAIEINTNDDAKLNANNANRCECIIF